MRHFIPHFILISSLISAYLMRKYKRSFPYCIDMIRKSYSEASPNLGFIQQLISYEKMGYRVKGVSQMILCKIMQNYARVL